VGDDSTGTAVSVGETIKIAGTSNITTAVSGDTLTITGPNLSSYLTNSTITVVGDDSSGVTLNSNETIKIAGTSNITTAVSGDTLTITGPNLTNYAQKSDTAITLVSDDSTGTAVAVVAQASARPQGPATRRRQPIGPERGERQFLGRAALNDGQNIRASRSRRSRQVANLGVSHGNLLGSNVLDGGNSHRGNERGFG
jgi:hypothetical protein